MTEKITSQLKEVYNKGRTAKNLIPQSRIPDLGWNTDKQDEERLQLPVKKQPEAAVTQTTPEQGEGPPSSRLRSKTKTTTPSTHMDPPERNPTTVDPLNAMTEVNVVQTVRKAGFGWPPTQARCCPAQPFVKPSARSFQNSAKHTNLMQKLRKGWPSSQQKFHQNIIRYC